MEWWGLDGAAKFLGMWHGGFYLAVAPCCFPSTVQVLSHHTTLEWAAPFHQDLLHTFCLGSAHSDGDRSPCTKNSENKNQDKPLFSSGFELFLSTPYHNNRKLADLSPRKLLFYLFANSCRYLLPMCVHVCRDTCVEGRENLSGVSFLLLSCGFWGGALGRCAWKSKHFYSLTRLLCPVWLNSCSDLSVWERGVV